MRAGLCVRGGDGADDERGEDAGEVQRDIAEFEDATGDEDLD